MKTLADKLFIPLHIVFWIWGLSIIFDLLCDIAVLLHLPSPPPAHHTPSNP